MKLDIFTEIQDPGPRQAEREHARFTQAIEQAKLADELGYDCWWQVEHHGADEFSLSSAPELLLTAISQQTNRLRLGHSAVLAPAKFNHPIRIAERAATLDQLSNGRLEMGLTRSTIPEWRLFGIDPADARTQTQQAFEMVPRMWTEELFSYQSEFFDIRDVPVRPKPVQTPHPPLWQAAASPPAFEEAGKRGVGVLGTTLWEPIERVRRLIGLYRDASAACRNPVGAFQNEQVAFFTFVHCADTDEEAMRHGAATAAAWYTVKALTFFDAKTMFLEAMARGEEAMKDPANLTGQFVRDDLTAAPTEAQLVIGRLLEGEQVPDDEIFEALNQQDSLIVGSPDTCRKKLRAYADLGVDRLMCFHQVGSLPHDQVMKSMRLIGELIPEFAS